MNFHTSWLSPVLNMAGTERSLLQLATTTGRGRWGSSGVFISYSGLTQHAAFGTLGFFETHDFCSRPHRLG